MSKRTRGLQKDHETGTWIIDKIVHGERIFIRTGERSQDAAAAILERESQEIRRRHRFGEHETRIFREAATHYLNTEKKRSLGRDALDLKIADPWIGHYPLDEICDGLLIPFKEHRSGQRRRTSEPFKSQGVVKAATINRTLRVIHRVLVLCAKRYRDGTTPWLRQAPPEFVMIPETDKKQPYPLSWSEEELLLSEFPEYLRRMAIFAVNTGARDAEVRNLKWDWEMLVPSIDRTAFLIPAEYSKNKVPGLLFVSCIAEPVVEMQRDLHPTLVFPGPRGGVMDQMCGRAWQQGRKRAAERYRDEIGIDMPERFRTVSPHDLRHTFGHRLRAAGVSKDDRRDLLRHGKADVTDHYSAADIENLYHCVDAISAKKSRKSHALLVVKRTRFAPK